MRIDFEGVRDIEDLRSVPPDEYVCRIAEVRVSQSPSGHERWGLRWEAAEGDFQGRTVCWDSLHWSERGLPRARYVLSVLGFPVDRSLELEPSDLEGRRARVTVEPEERVDPSTGIRRLLNRVPFAGYRPLEAAEPEAGEAGPLDGEEEPPGGAAAQG